MGLMKNLALTLTAEQRAAWRRRENEVMSIAIHTHPAPDAASAEVDPLDAAFAPEAAATSAPAPAPTTSARVPTPESASTASPMPAPVDLKEASRPLVEALAASSSSTPAGAPKRPTLFDLEADFLSIIAALDDGAEIEDAAIEKLAARLLEVDDAIDRKAGGWGVWIRQLEADALAPKSEGQRLQKRGLGYEKLAKRLREKLRDVLNRVGKGKVKTALLTLTLKAGQPSVRSVDLNELPARFLVPPPPPPKPAADEDKILAEFKRTGIVPPGVTIAVSEWDEKKGPAPAGVVVDPAKKILEIR
jgi:hypothetical protein